MTRGGVVTTALFAPPRRKSPMVRSPPVTTQAPSRVTHASCDGASGNVASGAPSVADHRRAVSS